MKFSILYGADFILEGERHTVELRGLSLGLNLLQLSTVKPQVRGKEYLLLTHSMWNSGDAMGGDKFSVRYVYLPLIGKK